LQPLLLIDHQVEVTGADGFDGIPGHIKPAA
jgi:hypothetical protein